MAAIMLIVLLLPACVMSFIFVNIDVDKNHTVKVRISGLHDDYLTDQDRRVFQIKDHELKQGVYMLTGELPEDVEVGSPYSNEMHSEYSLEIVRRTVVPIEYKIISKEVLDVKVDRSDPYNYYDLTVLNEWDAFAMQFMPGEYIVYGFWLVLGNVNLNYKNRSVVYAGKFAKYGGWNSGVRTGKGVSPIPGNQMYAKKLVLKVKIKYEMSLHGYVACEFNTEHEGSFYWGYDVNACLIKACRPTKKYASEVVKVIFYYDEEFRA